MLRKMQTVPDSTLDAYAALPLRITLTLQLILNLELAGPSVPDSPQGNSSLASTGKMFIMELTRPGPLNPLLRANPWLATRIRTPPQYVSPLFFFFKTAEESV